MKKLQLSLKTEWFEMTKSGVKKEDYREINDYWIKRLIDEWITFGASHKIKVSTKEKACTLCASSIRGVTDEVRKRDIKFKIFDANSMTFGYPKAGDKSRIVLLEHKGIEIRQGNPDWGAKPGELYFVILHGEIIE